MVVGVTGGYCSGKSIACSIIEESGFVHIDVDRIGHDVLDDKREEVVREFGKKILPGGKIDRGALGDLVFRDRNKRRMLESILHPLMIERVKRIVEKEHDAVISAALLVEMGLHLLCDFVLGVQVDEEIALQRGMKRDGLSRDEAKLRIGSQIPLKEKLQYVDKVIENNTTVGEFRKRLRQTVKGIKHGRR